MLRESHRSGIEPATCKSQVQRPAAETPQRMYEESVGSGACAAVMLSKCDEDDVWIQTSAVGTRVKCF